MKNTDLKEREYSLLFLEYIINNGFNPNNYENILEYYLIKDYYIGFITNKSDKNLEKKLEFYHDLLEEINIAT